jgi:23S rRNA (cytosine1962-C5)-methyltransferase
VIDKQQFTSILLASAISVGRTVKILHQLHQGADHPISIFHPEGEYLKGLVLEVI